jgi:uncharacterized damage-inducible protein DinB
MTIVAESTEQTLAQPLLTEFREEAAITRRVLERVPAGKLTWSPHPKSMTLGQLAGHVANIPGGISRIASQDSLDVAKANFVAPQPNSLEEIIAAFEQSARDGEQFLRGLTDQQATASWHLLRNGAVVRTQPRIGVIRTIMLNHWYHHRGQLSVYLRLLEVPVPVIYGRSADENPFA